MKISQKNTRCLKCEDETCTRDIPCPYFPSKTYSFIQLLLLALDCGIYNSDKKSVLDVASGIVLPVGMTTKGYDNLYDCLIIYSNTSLKQRQSAAALWQLNDQPSN